MTHRSDWLERLSKLDTCVVSDALDSLKMPGTVTGISRLATNRRVCGRVLTVALDTMRPGHTSSRHLCTRAIEAATPSDVIVVRQRTGLDAAGWGGVLSTAAQVGQVAGVIVEGPARDIDESIALDFPVFARFATARTARGRICEISFNEPIRVGDVTVHFGDLVIADASGVAFIPQERAQQVLEVAERICVKEALMVRAVLEGTPVGQVMGVDYELMLGANA